MREEDEQGEILNNGSTHIMNRNNFTDKIWLFPVLANGTNTTTNTVIGTRSSPVVVLFFFVLVLCVGAFVSTRLLDSSATSITEYLPQKSAIFKAISFHNNHTGDGDTPAIPENGGSNFSTEIQVPLNCSNADTGRPTCPLNYYPSNFTLQSPPSSPTHHPTCPDYFRWIHEDLWPWRETGITKEMVEMARRTATFRLVVLNGKAYLERYSKSFQSRDTFTLWGILQLLRKYPGKIPDLDMMFDCVDWPVVKKQDHCRPNSTAAAPPPLFRYCGDDTTLDIVFPDWSFWGWPEINIKPWETLSEELKEGNERIKWEDREPYAYWKGNPAVAQTRMDLLKCNVSDKQDWNARVYGQDWLKEQKEGYKQSDLASQCNYRYKIYIEGSAWSVSEKYILACDSVTLLVKPRYYDFFTRSLMPLEHYWPVKEDDKCKSIKYAVEWGNTHSKEAQAIGRAASSFIQDDLAVNYVYDYMFHLLNQYSKLIKYKPTIPPKAIELCSEFMACSAKGLEKKFMTDSIARGPSITAPCKMPPPYDPATLHSILKKKEDSIKQVEVLEKLYWDSQK